MVAFYPLCLHHVRHSFTQGVNVLTVLKGIDLTLKQGEIVALVGPSGAGKTTLLQIAGLLEMPSAGSVQVAGQSCQTLTDTQRTLLRRQYLGFVYQFHHLLPEFSSLENVILPQLIAGKPKKQAEQRAQQLLETMGLANRLHHRPKQLSGGEQQRVAIARALANRPMVLLADEPTGNLDHSTGEQVFHEMLTLVRETQMAALIATHNQELAARMDRTIVLKDGLLC